MFSPEVKWTGLHLKCLPGPAHSGITRMTARWGRLGLAWLYGILWFIPLPFFWAVVLFRLHREQAKT